MLTNFILSDILQHVFNLYIDWRNDSEKLINVINFHFDIKHHIIIEYGKPMYEHVYNCIYIDGSIYKEEMFYVGKLFFGSIGKKVFVNIYKNNKLYRKIVYILGYEPKVEPDVSNVIKYLYHQSSQLTSIKKYKNGKLSGTQTNYNLNGDTSLFSSRINYRNGVKDGISEFYTEDGILESTEKWINGNLSSEQKYNRLVNKFKKFLNKKIKN
jgi:antitoxin component YwqK of YwqJK toxin-antitoxin module